MKTSELMKIGDVKLLRNELTKFYENVSWFIYRKQFQEAVHANGWGDDMKVTALLTALRGRPLDVSQKSSDDQ